MHFRHRGAGFGKFWANHLNYAFSLSTYRYTKRTAHRSKKRTKFKAKALDPHSMQLSLVPPDYFLGCNSYSTDVHDAMKGNRDSSHSGTRESYVGLGFGI